MRKVLVIFFVFLIIIFSGCTNTKTNEEIINPVISDEELYNKMFSKDEYVQIYIDITDEELRKIQEDYEKYSAMGSKSPIYRKCNLEIKIGNYIFNIDEVGIRMKGNTSRRNFYSSDKGIYDLIHYKLSFSETFDGDEYVDKKVWTSEEERKARKDRLFAGMEKLDLKWNKCYDSTHVREIYTYELFRKMGLVAPHATLSHVYINNKEEKVSLGVFNLFESVDKIFIKKYFEDAINSLGDLYKIGWGVDASGNHSGGTLLSSTNHSNSIGVEDEDKCYFPIYDLKTNKKKSDHSSLKNLITEINHGDFSKVNIEYVLKFLAVTYLCGNPDDFRSHYNNYYLYFDKDLLVIIPYDYDRCFGITREWNPLNAMTGIDPNSLYTTELGENVNPIIREVLSNLELKKKYNDYLKEFSNNDFYTIEKFRTYYESYKTNYSNKVKPTLNSVKDKYISFSLGESNNPNDWNKNYSISEYLKSIKKQINILA